MPLIDDPIEAVHKALIRPTGCAPLAQIAAGAKSACILICDITRPVPNGMVLGPIIDCLLASEIEPSNILILVATGLHRPNEGKELETLIGNQRVFFTIPISNHIAEQDSDHISIGESSIGTPVSLDKRFVNAELKIAVGLVEPHFMAGYSGGRKVVAPGIASARTIRYLHSTKILNNSNCRACHTTNNPLHRELLSIVRMLKETRSKGIFAVNTVIDEERRLGFVNFGEIEASHEEAMEFAGRYCEVPVSKKFETVLTSAAGYPLDQTYYQAIKGMVSPLDILENDGTLVLAAECGEGIGSTHFQKAQQKLVDEGPTTFLQGLNKKEFADIDEWETEMQLKAQKNAHVCLFSDKLSEAQGELTSVQILKSVEEGIELALSRARTKEIAVIPEGPYVIPRFHQAV